jgi:hypothetical protein
MTMPRLEAALGSSLIVRLDPRDPLFLGEMNFE